jgi:hypothetical protein
VFGIAWRELLVVAVVLVAVLVFVRGRGRR